MLLLTVLKCIVTYCIVRCSVEGKAEIEDLGKKIVDLKGRLSDFKSEAQRVLDSRYVQFKSQLNENKNLAGNLCSLSEQMDELQYRIEKQVGYVIFIIQ